MRSGTMAESRRERETLNRRKKYYLLLKIQNESLDRKENKSSECELSHSHHKEA